ncbi:DUF4270 domain-containing protein [Flagellimonas sp. HMM57]|uniref:DUF4270 family protein n=1 Tax=unclassified Flagellimonas TaxID=2644544 RepID=UPI0013D1CD20|nr:MULTISPECIES: DUF4270 family protein [unclassified Flagellimonas]UII74798.1 DUF4270 domain-containing protein [Flagellimonas sp. HMM57]
MLRIIGVLGILLLVLLACSEDNLNSDFVAGEAFTDSNIRVLLVDTLTVETSTMKFDSIITATTTRMLIGKYTDSVFGTVQSSSYAELLPSTYTIDTEAEYDSIVFYLKYDEYYYNDTLQTNGIHIKELTEQMKPEDDENFYNSSTIAYADEDLGYIDFSPRPLQTDSIEIKLNDDFGIALFEGLQDKTLTNSDEFTEYLKGVAFIPDETNNGSVLGFLLESSIMRLYFSISEENDQEQYFTDFSVNTFDSPLPFFNQITAENPNDYLASLTDQEINLSSSESENQSYIQSGIGIATRIQFPHIKSIYDIPGQGTILDAVLKIKPTEGAYNDELILRDNLSVYIVDQNNDLTGQLLVASTSPVVAVLNTDGQEFNDIYYEISLGSYIEELLRAERDTDEALILLPDDYNTTVDRFVLNGNTSPDYQTTLELTYAVYDENE